VVVDAGFRATHLNQAFCRQFGVTPENARGRAIEELCCGNEDRSGLRAALDGIASGTRTDGGVTITCDIPGIGRRTMRLKASPMRGTKTGRPEILLALDDVTDREHADDIVRRRQAELALLHRILIASNECTDVSDLLQFTVDHVCAHSGWPVGHVWLVPQGSTGQLVSARIWHLADAERFAAFRLASETIRFAPDKGLVGRVLATAAPVWTAALAPDEARALSDARAHGGIHTGLAAPILVGTEVVGVIEFFSDERIEPDESLLNVVRDIGTVLGRAVERKRAQDALHAANAALEQRIADRTASLEAANQELESFTYSVAHDLRGPLRAINGFAHILLDSHAGGLDDKAQRYLRLVEANAERLGRLIDDLLLFSRLSRQTLAKREVDATALVREVLEHLSFESGGRQLDVELQELPTCHADPQLLKQVFTNLLSNALKFTRPQPHPRIEIGWQSGSAGSRRQVYFVRDNGVGFDMQYAHKLFGVFERLHREEEFEGTGVGLAIAQRIIDRHGGRLWAEGEVGKGATFYFSLPGDGGRD